MRILGIDPGTAITGFGVIDSGNELTLVEADAILTAAGTPLPERLLIIYDQLSAVIARHRPDAVAVEELFFSKNVRTAMSVGQARGVVLLTAAQAGLPIYHYKPAEVKQAVAGYGGADKTQIQEMVRLLLDLDTVFKPDDIADAVAIAICHAHAAHLENLLTDD